MQPARVGLVLLLLGGAVAADPTAFERGVAALAGGDAKAAEAAFDECLKAGTSKAALVNRALARHRNGKVQEAFADLDAAHGLDTDDAVVLYNRAVLRACQALDKSVVADLTRVAELVGQGKGGAEVAAQAKKLPHVVAEFTRTLRAVAAAHEQVERASADQTQAAEDFRANKVSADAVDLARVRVLQLRWQEAALSSDLDAEKRYRTLEVAVCQARWTRATQLLLAGAGQAEEAEVCELRLRAAEVGLFLCEGRKDDILKALESHAALLRSVHERAARQFAAGNIPRAEVDAKKAWAEQALAQLKQARQVEAFPKRTGGVADRIGPPLVCRAP